MLFAVLEGTSVLITLGLIFTALGLMLPHPPVIFVPTLARSRAR